jgi:2',3'-cyclic-nucleotide 2'-phosphodiesterase (5'-nucleotidase family)
MSGLVVYHTADIHSAKGFGQRLAAIVEPASLLVDAGDALAGSSVFYRGKEPVIDELAKAPYTAMAVGNREFHYLHSWFAARAHALPMPLVCSNLIDLRGRPPVFVRELTTEVQGVAVRILALLVPQYHTGSGWERIFGWRFLAPDAALGELLSKPAGAQFTLLLSHLGSAADVEVAGRWSQFAAIFGGHTHDAYSEPRIVNDIPIVHPGAHANYVGRLELALEGTKPRVVSYRLIAL